jgi:hypothetical protein
MHIIGRGRYARETYPSRSAGAASDFTFQNRVDCSVNSAHVEAPYTVLPVLHAQSGGNTAGGYNGGGTGNKSILGFRVGNGLSLSLLSSIEWTWLDLNPATSGLPVYANLVIDVYGDGSVFKIGVIDPSALPVLNNGNTVLNLDGSRTTTWLGASDNILIVNGLSAAVPAAGPPYVPPDVQGAAPPTYGFTGGWPASSYKLSTILGAYPNATLAEANSLDGGLPKSPNKTPALLLVTGDSTNQIIRAFRLSNVRFNGALV